MEEIAVFLSLFQQALTAIRPEEIEQVLKVLLRLQNDQGRLFLLGSGGGAGHASHAACDFRKLCYIEAYAPYDNVSELTARVNDEGWETSLVRWLQISRLSRKDAVLVFSVGGGSLSPSISMNLVRAMQYAKECSSQIIGIVGSDGGYTKQLGDAVIVVPTVDLENITPITEGLQAVLWHLLVSHPSLRQQKGKWEEQSVLLEKVIK